VSIRRTGLPRDGAPEPAGRGSGFQAHIKGATLADLIQMECLSGARRVVRVTSGTHTGFLYFRSGAVVHATTRTITGEDAVLDMLSWS
jgi:hypothetical protein